MKSFIIFALSLVTVYGLPHNEAIPSPVRAGAENGRMVKGYNAFIGQFPYQVGLMLGNYTNIYKKCGGSIIGHEWVLTAAHCTESALEGTIYLGGISYQNATLKHKITKKDVIIHPGWNNKTAENDISLIKIPFTKFDKYIQKVNLPTNTKPDLLLEGDEVIVTGWGRTTDSSSKSSKRLLWGSMNVISNAECSEYFNIFPSNICAISLEGVNICNGDSGGPVVLRPMDERIQVGIVSFGRKKCEIQVPAVNARVSSYLEWIKEKTGIPN